MLFRVRATLADRPGSLARLAAVCGEAGVNIVGLQVFPAEAAVTDELVLDTPEGYGADRVHDLLEGAGATGVVASPCTPDALVDQPTRYVQACRAVLDAPESFPDVVARLFDAGVRSGEGAEDVMEMTVADVQVQIRRATPFTEVERLRGAAVAELVGDVIGREQRAPTPSRRMGTGAEPTYVVAREEVTALADGVAIGRAVVRDAPSADEPDTRALDIEVDPVWQRRGIGTRLLADAARLARGLGAEAVLLTTDSDNRAVMPMVLAAGMRGRIRMAGDTLTVRISVTDLRPLQQS